MLNPKSWVDCNRREPAPNHHPGIHHEPLLEWRSPDGAGHGVSRTGVRDDARTYLPSPPKLASGRLRSYYGKKCLHALASRVKSLHWQLNTCNYLIVKSLTGDNIRELVRREAAKVGGIAWCKENKISDSFLYEVLRGMREPSAKLANTLGYRRVIRFEPFE